MSENKKKLFEEFPPISTEAWEEKIHKDLKGADYDKKLVWKTLEGFNVKPYYRSEDLENLSHINYFPGSFPYVRGKNTNDNNWFVRQDIKVDNTTEANKKALDILMKGVNAIGYNIDDKKEIKSDEFEALLKDICLSVIETNFECGHKSHDILKWFVSYVKDNNLNTEEIQGSVDFDPLGRLTLRGNFCESADHSFNKAKELIELGKDLPNFKNILVHGNYFHNSGSSIVQELAFSLATGAEYLYHLTQKGVSVDDVAPKIKFKFSVGANYFMEIAKLRAAKMLWSKIVESYNPCCQKKAKMNIHCETSKWNLTVYDPHVNMLRSTTEAMSAALGATDSLTVLPFDISHKESSDFSERIARNTQTVLKEEAYFDKIVDPSAGSYYIENLTDSIAESAWELFKAVEDKGGYIEAFKAGFVQEKINETAKKRDMNIATRKDILLGTNQFPSFSESYKGEIKSDVVERKSDKVENAIAEPLVIYRGAMAFEEIRLRTEKAEKTPKVFMLTYGNLAMRKARATFACNFFACAGFEVVDNFGFKTVDEGINATLEANADIVVICSSDDEYATIVPEIYEKLNGKAITVVAGYPKDCIDDLKAKGITNFIHVKSNVLEILSNFQNQMNL